MSSDFEKRLIRLESLVSMQDDMIETLNEVITRQHMDLQALQRELKNMQETIEQEPIDMNQRPPHY
ncbi:SlyX family protein [Lentisphaera marina]|uniref:SlyX family protein n=1 Tax=Lentisphaera marina TaxID=1111041 RepID=UPI0023669F75|nr:SlyX family protein [Lentisphaera marina]MDD7986092.1 SlyX family protein [Lentisphaera marina]